MTIDDDHLLAAPSPALADTRPAPLAPGRAAPTARLAPSSHAIARHVMRLMRKERDGNGVAAGADDAVAHASGSAGEPLPDGVRARFEGSLGADLSGVRVHTGAASAAAADAVGARAFAIGNDVHFAAGQYAPADPFGVHLLAHEVAHTVQQSGGGAAAPQYKLEVSTPGDAAEVEADRAADAMVAGAPMQVSRAPAAVARKKQHFEPPWGTDDPKNPNKPYAVDIDGMGYVFPDAYAPIDTANPYDPPGTKPPPKDKRAYSSGETADWTDFSTARQLKVPKGTKGRLRFFVEVASGPVGTKLPWFTLHHELAYDNTGPALKIIDIGTTTDVPPPPDGVHVDADWKPVIADSATPPTVSVNPSFVGPNQTSKQSTSSTGEAFTWTTPKLPILPQADYQQQWQHGMNSAVRQSTNAAIQVPFLMALAPEKNPVEQPQGLDLSKIAPLQILFASDATALTSDHITQIDAWVHALPADVQPALGMMSGGELKRRELLVYVIGHASHAAPDTHNQDLSVKRSSNVQKQLQARMGDTVSVHCQSLGEQEATGGPDSDVPGDRKVDVKVMRDPDR